jgi:molybdate transport system permease protein
MDIHWADFAAPVWLSVKISVITSIIVFILAAAAARAMAHRKFRGRSLVETVLLLPLVLPPTVIGFMLLVILGRRSWIGRLYEAWTGQSILFTWGAAVLAAVVVAFPLAYRTIKAGFEEVDPDLEDSARAQGASELQVLRYVSLPLASRSLTAGYILGFARGLGEFGATIMIAGNIPGRTQTIPTAIYAAVDGGNMSLAWMWVCSIIVISAVMLMFVNRSSSSGN